MGKGIGFAFACLLAANAASAETIVTWQGDGMITSSSSFFPPHSAPQIAPPPGTPLAVSLTFAPSSATQFTSGRPDCQRVTVSASVSIGSFTYTGGGLGFTNAMLPGSNCSNNGFTQFSLHSMADPPGTPWSLHTGGVLILSFADLVMQDAFPESPTIAGLANLFYTSVVPGEPTWTFNGTVSLQAVDPATPVPEPATLTMLGLGLAAVVRRTRLRRR